MQSRAALDGLCALLRRLGAVLVVRALVWQAGQRVGADGRQLQFGDSAVMCVNGLSLSAELERDASLTLSTSGPFLRCLDNGLVADGSSEVCPFLLPYTVPVQLLTT